MIFLGEFHNTFISFTYLVDNANFTRKKRNNGGICINCEKRLIEFGCEYFL